MTAALQHPGYDPERLLHAAEKMPCRVGQAGTLLSLMGEVSKRNASVDDIMHDYVLTVTGCAYYDLDSTAGPVQLPLRLSVRPQVHGEESRRQHLAQGTGGEQGSDFLRVHVLHFKPQSSMPYCLSLTFIDLSPSIHPSNHLSAPVLLNVAVNLVYSTVGNAICPPLTCVQLQMIESWVCGQDCNDM